MGDLVSSIVLMGQQAGPVSPTFLHAVELTHTFSQLGGYGFPNWPLVHANRCTMDGQSAQNIIADAYLWGVRNFDVATAYALMKSDAFSPKSPCSREGCVLVGSCETALTRCRLSDYDGLGYIPLEVDAKGGCKTVDYAHKCVLGGCC